MNSPVKIFWQQVRCIAVICCWLGLVGDGTQPFAQPNQSREEAQPQPAAPEAAPSKAEKQ